MKSTKNKKANESDQGKSLRYKRPLAVFLFGASLMLAAWLNGVYLSPRADLQQADAVIAISGGDTRARTLLAAEVYKQGWAQKVIFSGSAYDSASESNASAMRTIAVESGVPSQIISLSENAENTTQNASEVSEILKAQGAQKIILITSEYHQRRASIEFTNELEKAGVENAELINFPAKESGWSRAGWWTTARGWWLTVGEDAKIITGAIGQANK